MKRNGVTCLAIVAYCMLASFTMFKPSASAAQKSTLTVNRKTVSDTQFASQPNLINPNKVFSLVNSERASFGSSNLQANVKLAQIASVRAKDLVTRKYYAHKNPDGKYFYDLFSQYGFSSEHSCENLDMVFSNDPGKVVSDWMASTHGHRECLINNSITEAGYAVAKLTDVHYGSTTTTAYVVVAIHSTDIF